MNKNELVFTDHAKVRALERMLNIPAPHTADQLQGIEELVLRSSIWNPLKEQWEIEGFNLILIISHEHGAQIVVTIKPKPQAFYQYDRMNKHLDTRKKG